MEIVLFFIVALLTGTLGVFGSFLGDLINTIGGLFG
jgi:hypothetical protein